MTRTLDFARDGVAVCRGLLAPQTRALIGAEYQIMLANNRLRLGDSQVDKGYAAYGMTVSDALMETLRPTVEAATGHALFPTYSYARIYLAGAALARHVDRPACEISLSLTVASENGISWPLHCRSANYETVTADLAPGDGVIYRGMDLPHWREPFTGTRQLQLFLHYVRQDGPYAAQRYDGRSGLGAPAANGASLSLPPFAIFQAGKVP